MLEYVNDRELPMRVLNVSLPDEYIEHGNVDLLYKEVGLDPEQIAKRVITDYISHM